MNLKSAALLAALALAWSAPAAPVTRDLGRGLAYERVHALPGDLPAEATPAGAVVLDLRYVKATAESAASVQAWLRFHATAITPVMVLLNPGTDATVRDAVARLAGAPGLLVLASGHLPADIQVDAAADDERKAYDALEAEPPVPVATLITQNADKPRHDEASLAKPATAADDDRDPDPVDTNGADAPPPPPFDALLARAVGIHRALLALDRLPKRR